MTNEPVFLADVDSIFRRDFLAFEKLKPSLLKDPNLRGKCVAIKDGKIVKDGQVIVTSSDKIALFELMKKRFGSSARFFVDQVTDKRQVIQLPIERIKRIEMEGFEIR